VLVCIIGSDPPFRRVAKVFYTKTKSYFLNARLISLFLILSLTVAAPWNGGHSHNGISALEVLKVYALHVLGLQILVSLKLHVVVLFAKS